MKIISIKLPEAYLREIDKLIEEGRFTTRSELIRYALMDFFRKEKNVDLLHEKAKVLLGP